MRGHFRKCVLTPGLAPTCKGLQSKWLRTAITAFLGPDYLPLSISPVTSAHLESALAVLLSRTPLDLVTGASHHTKNHPIETPQLSLPPCPMRVDLIKTRGRRVRRDGLLLCATSVAVNVVLGRWIAVRCGSLQSQCRFSQKMRLKHQK